jgi:hypothetical protein
MVSKHYLKDITGGSELIDFNKLLEELGLKKLLPDSVQTYIEDLKELQDGGVHQYLCNIDKSPKGENCDVGRALAQREQKRFVGWVQWDTNKPLRLLYSYNGNIHQEALPTVRKQNTKPISLGKKRFTAGRKLRSSNLASTVLGQGLSNKPSGTFLTRSVILDRKGDNKFHKAVEGGDGYSVGDRAVLFNQDGSITTGANRIRDIAVGRERSSNIPAEIVSNGSIPKKISQATPYKASQHPNKSKIAGTTDAVGGIAALGGITALAAIVALLTPLHFVTSAITFLTSITTFFTNVNNAANTYLTVVDSLLGIFGIKGTKSKLKAFIVSIADNALGKQNLQEVKNAFASGVNSIAVTTKMLEKVQSMRDGTDDKVDELALSLGAMNNAMGAAGLIPPELMATSKAIDELVSTRTKGDEELKNNITSLTTEIKTADEAEKSLKDEQIARDKINAKIQKDIKDVEKLVSVVKTNVDNIDVNKL